MLKDLLKININFIKIIKKIWLIPFSIFCTSIFIWVINSYSSAINLRDNDLANWTTLSIEAGILLPIAYIIGNHFFRKEQKNEYQKDIQVIQLIITKLEKCTDDLTNLINTYSLQNISPSDLKKIRKDRLIIFEKSIARVIETITNKRVEDDVIVSYLEEIEGYYSDTFRQYIDVDEKFSNNRFLITINEVKEMVEAVIDKYKTTIKKLDNF